MQYASRKTKGCLLSGPPAITSSVPYKVHRADWEAASNFSCPLLGLYGLVRGSGDVGVYETLLEVNIGKKDTPKLWPHPTTAGSPSSVLWESRKILLTFHLIGHVSASYGLLASSSLSWNSCISLLAVVRMLVRMIVVRPEYIFSEPCGLSV